MRSERSKGNATGSRTTRSVLAGLVMALGLGCNGAGPSPTSPVCDQACRDAVALRATRETLKQVFNGALQAMPVGAQDRTYDCTPFGGSAHITGTATSNANVGTTTVNLTYVLENCRYVASDTDPNQNYDITLTGTAKEDGVIAVQPGTTTSLTITSDAMTLSGTVYSPPLPFPDDAGTGDGGAGACSVQLAQNGNQLSGTICGRTAGLTL
jgi:hypothetical protein